MSRVGKAPIKIPSGVKIEIKGNQVKVEGPKGKLNYSLPQGVSVKSENGQVLVAREANLEGAGALQGVCRTNIANMIQGVHAGFQKDLDVVGVGYRAAVKGNTLNLTVGYSHPVDYELPAGVKAVVENNTHIVITGADKVLVGMVAAKVRSFRPPEPYQGKGIKYTDERIIRKQGKAAGAK